MTGMLGKEYNNGEMIINEGDISDSMFIIQEGRVEIITKKNGKEIKLAVREKGDFIGEMSIFLKQTRTAGVRALGKVRILTIDKSNFLKRIHEDPAIAFKLVESLSRRVQELSKKVAELQSVE